MHLDPSSIEVVDDAMAEVLRKKTPAERLAIGVSLWRSARTLVRAYLRQEHPEWSEEVLKQELNRRFLNGTF